MQGLQRGGRGAPPPSGKRPALAPPSAPPCGMRKPSKATARAGRAGSQLAAAVSAAPPPGARRRRARVVRRAGRVQQVLSRASAPAGALGCGAARRGVLRSLSPTPGRRGQRCACAGRCAAPGRAARVLQASSSGCGGRVPTGSSRRGATRSPSVERSPHCSAEKAPSCARAAAIGGHTARQPRSKQLQPRTRGSRRRSGRRRGVPAGLRDRGQSNRTWCWPTRPSANMPPCLGRVKVLQISAARRTRQLASSGARRAGCMATRPAPRDGLSWGRRRLPRA